MRSALRISAQQLHNLTTRDFFRSPRETLDVRSVNSRRQPLRVSLGADLRLCIAGKQGHPATRVKTNEILHPAWGRSKPRLQLIDCDELSILARLAISTASSNIQAQGRGGFTKTIREISSVTDTHTRSAGIHYVCIQCRALRVASVSKCLSESGKSLAKRPSSPPR